MSAPNQSQITVPSTWFHRINGWVAGLFDPNGDNSDRTITAIGIAALLGLAWFVTRPVSNPPPVAAAAPPRQREQEPPSVQPVREVRQITDKVSALKVLAGRLDPAALEKLKPEELQLLGQHAGSLDSLGRLLEAAPPTLPLWAVLMKGVEANQEIAKDHLPGVLHPHLKQGGKMHPGRLQLITRHSGSLITVLFWDEKPTSLLQGIKELEESDAKRSKRIACLYVESPDLNRRQLIAASANQAQYQCDLLVGTARLARKGDQGAQQALDELRTRLKMKGAYITPEHLKLGDLLCLYFEQLKCPSGESGTYKAEVVKRLTSWESGIPFPTERVTELELTPGEFTALVKLQPTASVQSTLVVWCVSQKKGPEVAAVLEGYSEIPFNKIPSHWEIVTQLRNTGGVDWWIEHKGKVAAALRSAIGQPEGLNGVEEGEKQDLRKFFSETLGEDLPKNLQ